MYLLRQLLATGLAAALLSSSAVCAEKHPLEGTAWRLTKVQGVAVPEGATLTFEPDRVTGSTGCNQFWAPIDYLLPPRLDIGPPQSARLYCLGMMSIERAYLASLETVVSFAVDGSVLKLMLDDGDVFIEMERTSPPPAQP